MEGAPPTYKGGLCPRTGGLRPRIEGGPPTYRWGAAHAEERLNQSSFRPARRPRGEERSTENRLRPCVCVNTALPPLLIRAHASDLWGSPSAVLALACSEALEKQPASVFWTPCEHHDVQIMSHLTAALRFKRTAALRFERASILACKTGMDSGSSSSVSDTSQCICTLLCPACQRDTVSMVPRQSTQLLQWEACSSACPYSMPGPRICPHL